MNIKYQKAVEGRADGDEILKSLGIQDSDRYEKGKLAAIEQTVQAINEGASLKDAVKSALIAAKGTVESTAITQQDSTAISQPFVSQVIPENVIQSIGSVAREIGTGDGDELPDAIASYTQEASENKNMGLKGVVQDNYFAGLLDSVQKPEFKDRIRESIKKLRAQTSKVK